MLYYLGKVGDTYNKDKCKEYKTKEGALKAANKGENLCVWDEDGNVIGTELGKPSEDSAEPEDSAEQQSEQEAEPEPEEETEPEQQSEPEPEQQSEAETGTETKVIIPQGKMKVTVICDGSLNIHRTPEWGESNICGRAIRGQTYYVKEIHMVDGRKMVRTVGDLYLSGETEFVQFEQL